MGQEPPLKGYYHSWRCATQNSIDAVACDCGCDEAKARMKEVLGLLAAALKDGYQPQTWINKARDVLAQAKGESQS